MNRLAESAIEDFAVRLFERLGYGYLIAAAGIHLSNNKTDSTN